MRASPTPSEMQMIHSNGLPWQENKCQKYSETPKVSKSPTGFHSLSTYKSGLKPEDSSKADGKKTEPGQLALNYQDKVKALGSDLLGEKRFETQSDGASSAWQHYASKSTQGLSSGNMLQSALLEKYNSLQNIPGSHQCVFSQGFNQVLPAGDLQKLPSSDPRLLNAPSLSTTPFAQQYLAGVTQMPHFTVGSHVGYPGCAHQGQSVHDPITGVALTANVASSILSALPIGNHTSGSNSHHIHLVDSQTGPAGLSQWATRLSSGFGKYIFILIIIAE